MAEDWDIDNFDPDAGFKKVDDRWEGEDVGIENTLAKTETAHQDTSNAEKKSKAERIEEKKALRRAQELDKLETEEKGHEVQPKLTPEELQQIQREKDLEVAKELFSGSQTVPSSSQGPGNDLAMEPKTVEEFKIFEDALVKKLATLEKSPHFVSFLEELTRRVCVPLDVEDLRRVSNTISAMANEKQKAKQTKKPKKTSKASLGSKSSKKAELGTLYDDFGVEGSGGGGGGDDDEYDFM